VGSVFVAIAFSWPSRSRAVGAVAQTKILRPDRTELHSAVPPGFRSQKLESPRVGKFDPTLQRSNFSTRLERLLVCAISGAALTTLQSHAQAITSIDASDPRLRDRFSCSLEGDLPRDAASGDLPTAESPSLGGRAGTPPPHCFGRIIARFRELSKRPEEHPATVSPDCARGILQIRLVAALPPRALERRTAWISHSGNSWRKCFVGCTPA